MKYLYLLMGLLVACSMYKESIDTEFVDYVNDFKQLVNDNCHNPTQFNHVTDIHFGQLSNPDGRGEVGRCEGFLYAGGTKIIPSSITIDRNYWESHEYMRRFLIYHEMSHCMLNYTVHSNNPYHYMYPDNFQFSILIQQVPGVLDKQVIETIKEKCK